MEWYEADVRGVEKEIASRNLTSPVVFYGSSSIRLWSNLAKDMGSEFVLNLGFGGSTLEACVYFFERILYSAKPVSLVLYAGDNDLGDGKSPADVLKYYKQFADKMQASFPGMPYGFISIKPSIARFGIIANISEANRLISEEIKNRPNAYYIDIFSLMMDEDGKLRRNLFEEDGLHVNSDGYKLWTEAVFQHRDQIFTRDFYRAHEA